jgi:general secretion pathway protein G
MRRPRFHAIGCILLLLAVAGCADRELASMEPALRQNLQTLRDLIEQYRSDQGHPPPTLGALVDRGYIRFVPYDPITRRNDTWIETRASGEGCGPSGIVEVHSGASGLARDGTRYADW